MHVLVELFYIRVVYCTDSPRRGLYVENVSLQEEQAGVLLSRRETQMAHLTG